MWGNAANLVARSRYYHCHWTLLGWLIVTSLAPCDVTKKLSHAWAGINQSQTHCACLMPGCTRQCRLYPGSLETVAMKNIVLIKLRLNRVNYLILVEGLLWPNSWHVTWPNHCLDNPELTLLRNCSVCQRRQEEEKRMTSSGRGQDKILSWYILMDRYKISSHGLQILDR